MVLVDTSSWIAHFKSAESNLTPYLLEGSVCTHDFVLGELTLGQFRPSDRSKVFERLFALERIETAAHEDVIDFIYRKKLIGKGVGWIDCHLLFSSTQSKIPLITLDRKLEKLAKDLLG